MIFVGMDDTDNAESGGTGRVARAIAADLRADYPVAGVTRHQFLVDPRIPYTSNNSSNVIHLRTAVSAPDRHALADRVERLLRAYSLPGSDPGLCVAGPEVSGAPFGPSVQARVLTQGDAWAEAARLGVVLRAAGGTGDGVIGALAGVILAAGGNDGRFVEVGRARELDGILSVAELAAAGIAAVRTSGGETLTAGRVDTSGGRVRPLLQGHRPVLLVELSGAGLWKVVELGKPHGQKARGHA